MHEMVGRVTSLQDAIQADIGKGLYRLHNTTTGKILKKGSERMQVSLYIIQNRPNMYPYQFIG